MVYCIAACALVTALLAFATLSRQRR
jgi:hypothetical protein